MSPPQSSPVEQDDYDDCRHYEPCTKCGGDGAHEYEGDPLDDYIDANPMLLVSCAECVAGTVKTCECALCRSGGCCYA